MCTTTSDTNREPNMQVKWKAERFLLVETSCQCGANNLSRIWASDESRQCWHFWHQATASCWGLQAYKFLLKGVIPLIVSHQRYADLPGHFLPPTSRDIFSLQRKVVFYPHPHHPHQQGLEDTRKCAEQTLIFKVKAHLTFLKWPLNPLNETCCVIYKGNSRACVVPRWWQHQPAGRDFSQRQTSPRIQEEEDDRAGLGGSASEPNIQDTSGITNNLIEISDSVTSEMGYSFHISLFIVK